MQSCECDGEVDARLRRLALGTNVLDDRSKLHARS